jgi:hypothetical protein
MLALVVIGLAVLAVWFMVGSVIVTALDTVGGAL